MTGIYNCNCVSNFQDETYGRRMRLFNSMGKDNKVSGYRCTVCGKELRNGDIKKK